MDRKELIKSMIEKYEEEIMVLQGCIATLETEKVKLIMKEMRDAKVNKNEGDKNG